MQHHTRSMALPPTFGSSLTSLPNAGRRCEATRSCPTRRDPRIRRHRCQGCRCRWACGPDGGSWLWGSNAPVSLGVERRHSEEDGLLVCAFTDNFSRRDVCISVRMGREASLSLSYAWEKAGVKCETRGDVMGVQQNRNENVDDRTSSCLLERAWCSPLRAGFGSVTRRKMPTSGFASCSEMTMEIASGSVVCQTISGKQTCGVSISRPQST